MWDRKSFRRLVGLGHQDETPDYTTIRRFRKELGRRGMREKLFEELGSQLERRGMMVKVGTLMEATLVETQVKRPRMSGGKGGKRDRPGWGLELHWSRGAGPLWLEGAPGSG